MKIDRVLLILIAWGCLVYVGLYLHKANADQDEIVIEDVDVEVVGKLNTLWVELPDSNDSSFGAIVLDIVDDTVIDDSITFTILVESGCSLELYFRGDKLVVTGDADMNEAAKVFFYGYLKPMADEYIAERLTEGVTYGTVDIPLGKYATYGSTTNAFELPENLATIEDLIK